MNKALTFLLLVPLFVSAQTPFDGRWRVIRMQPDPEVVVLQNGEFTCSTCVGGGRISVRADGADHPLHPGRGNTLAVMLLDDNAVQFTWKQNGNVVDEYTETVSPDGKTLTRKHKPLAPFPGVFLSGELTTLTRVGAGPAGAHAISGSWQRMRDKAKPAISELGLTITFKSIANGLRMNRSTGQAYDAKFDGKEYPVNGFTAEDAVSLTKVNDTTIVETYKNKGRIVNVNTIRVEGSTITIASKDDTVALTWTAEKERQLGPESGEVVENKYTSLYFKFTYVIPEKWNVLGAGGHKGVLDGVAKGIQDDRSNFGSGPADAYNLLAVVSQEGPLTIVGIAAESASHSPAVESARDYMFRLEQMLGDENKPRLGRLRSSSATHSNLQD